MLTFLKVLVPERVLDQSLVPIKKICGPFYFVNEKFESEQPFLSLKGLHIIEKSLGTFLKLVKKVLLIDITFTKGVLLWQCFPKLGITTPCTFSQL